MPVIAPSCARNSGLASASLRRPTASGNSARSVTWTFLRSLTALKAKPIAFAVSKVGYAAATSAANDGSRNPSITKKGNGSARAYCALSAGDVERPYQLPISHSCWITKSPSWSFATPCPVLNRSQRSMVNPIALSQ